MVQQNVLNCLYLLQLSPQEQQVFSGGQTLAEQLIEPLTTLRGKPTTSLGNALNDGSSTVLGNNTIQGNTSSGLFGSIGNSTGKGKGGATGAEDIMILPPFLSASKTI